MAAKYHINGDNKVERCRAFARRCPFVEYSSIEAAESAKWAENERVRREKDLAHFRKRLDTSGGDYYFPLDLSLDMGDNPLGRNRPFFELNKFLNQYNKTTLDPAVLYINAYVKDKAFVKTDWVAEIKRVPQSDSRALTIESSWKLVIHNKLQGKREIPLDFDGNYHGTVQEIREVFQDIAKGNMEDHLDSSEYSAAADRLVSKVENLYMSVEEFSLGADQADKKFKKMQVQGGTFSNAKESRIDVDIDITKKLFNSEMLRSYITDNDWLESQPDPYMFMRLYNTEGGKSDAWWGVAYNPRDRWSVQTGTSKSGVTTEFFSNSDDAGKYVESYVLNNMRTNDSHTAEISGQYVKDTMDSVSKVLIEHNKRIFRFVRGKNADYDSSGYALPLSDGS